MGEQKQKRMSESDALAEAEKMLKQIEKANEESNEGNPVEESVESDAKSVKSVAKAKKEKKPKQRSIKYKKSLEMVDRTKHYSLENALELVKKTSYTKFDGSVELHLKLEKVKKGDTIRGLLQLPHKAGKDVKVAVIDDALVEKIIADKKTDFDILIATPQMMPKIGRIAKILGPQGKMPNPKAGTVTADPDKAIKEIQSGRMEYKADDQGVIHLNIGKVSWDNEKLEANIKAVRNSLSGHKLQAITMSATMGPGIKLVI